MSRELVRKNNAKYVCWSNLFAIIGDAFFRDDRVLLIFHIDLVECVERDVDDGGDVVDDSIKRLFPLRLIMYADVQAMLQDNHTTRDYC